MKEVSEELQQDIKALLDHFQIEDKAVRERQIRQWRRLKLYWAGFTRVWYDEVAHDWRVWNNYDAENENDADYYDKPINIFRAYLESIIAAMSISIPKTTCTPEDADNPLDLATAKAGNKIAQLVDNHNNAQLVWLHSLFILCTEGLLAGYTYSKEDKEYGTYEEPEYEDSTVEQRLCPYCQTNVPDELFTSLERDEFAPDDEDVLLHDAIFNEGQIVCPECANQLDPELAKTKTVVTRIVGSTTKLKSRQCMEVYGGLYVKVPNYAKTLKDCPYLLFSYESHFSQAIEKYPKLRKEKFNEQSLINGMGGMFDPYEQWGRLSTQYQGEYPTNTVTCRNFWVRPSSYNVLNLERSKRLKKAFPDGFKAVFVNEDFAEACDENLDDCWTLTRNPLSDYVHYDPLGLLLTSVQDITNDLIALTLQTIEQGIPQTFIDPAVVDPTAYKNSESSPGSVYFTKSQANGKNINESFATLKTATLGQEVLPFGDKIQMMGQMVSGALPSLFGGMADAGSKTASEYAMSRSQALQRLQTPWKMLTFWWKEMHGKLITSYIKDAVDDEKFVTKDKAGNYLNVWIRKAELEGKIGEIELEPNENLPVTWQQKKDVFMQLFGLNNPLILEALSSPENIGMLREVIGIPEFVMPGEADRDKQNEEIYQLIASAPLDEFTPSVPIDPELDNNQVEAEMCRTWLIGEIGRQTKLTNPPGYLNVLLHYKLHINQVMLQQQQQAMMQQQQDMESGAGASNPKKTKKSAKVSGDSQNELRLPVS